MTRRSAGSGILVAVLILIAGQFPARAQTPGADGKVAQPAPEAMTAEQVEFQKKLGAAMAKASEDPEVIQASKKAMKALRDADRLMYEKIRKIDPSLSDYVEQALKTLPKESP